MSTSTFIHDPLLFYPYSQSLYQTGNNLSKHDYNDKDDNYSTYSSSTLSSTSSPSSTSSSPSTSPLSSIPSCADFDWNQILSSMKKTMYNSTSATVPSPATYICQNSSFTPDPSTDPVFFYNSGIRDVKDMYSYRQLRSENLLYRILNCPTSKIEVEQTSVMRLTKGVFVANKLQQSIKSSPPPVLGGMTDYMDSPFFNDVNGIDTFHYGDMQRFMIQQQQQQQQKPTDFIPYSYTFGARYTNPYHGRDVVIRGQGLPLWCQTLFLSECVNRMPLQPNVPYTGLFPFAPGFAVVFQQSLHQTSPDLTFIYEANAMELSSEPVNMMDQQVSLWNEHIKQIAGQMLFCDIPEPAAEVLTQLATLWANDQGLVL